MVARWAEGKKGRAASMSTRDGNLYSYNLLIGTTKRGKRIVYDYARQISGSTTRHVNLAKDGADEVKPPPKRRAWGP